MDWACAFFLFSRPLALAAAGYVCDVGLVLVPPSCAQVGRAAFDRFLFAGLREQLRA
jgi:hypothetical protein